MFKTLYIGPDGLPTDEPQPYEASCFVLFGWCFYIGKITEVKK